MSFLYPQFLYGLLALSIPVIIHLFNFRKAKRVYFSNNKFLRNIKKISSSKLKLKHLLVLLARLLFLFFLVLTFAQPMIPAEEGGLDVSDVYIYLDNSYSMSNEVEADLKAFDAAIDFSNQVAELYPKGTRLKLLTNDFAPNSNSFKTGEQVTELTTELKLSGLTRSMDQVENRFRSMESGNVGRRQFYWISDFQKSTLGNLEQWQPDTADSHFLVPLDFVTTRNVMVDSVFLSNPFLMVNESNELHVILRNTGDAEVQDMVIKLFINDIQSATASTSINANATAEVSFVLNTGLESFNRCRISFEEFPVTFDNDYFFTLNLSQKINVLEIRSGTSETPVSRVYGNQQLFNFSSYNVENLDYSLIGQADLVILNEIENIDPGLSSYLEEYLQKQGHLLLIPAVKPNLNSYRQLLEQVSVTNTEGQEKLEMNSPDLNNPFFEQIFENADRQFEMPQAIPVISWTGQGIDLLRFKNNRSFLTSTGNDRQIYLMASPLSDEYTNFHLHAVFVPVMYRIAALSQEMTSRYSYSIDQPVLVLRADSLDASTVYKLHRDEQVVIPGQRVQGNSLILEMPGFTLSPGFYELRNQEDIVQLLAFNQDRQESILAQYQADELSAIFSGNSEVNVFNVENVDNFGREMKEKHFGVSLWKYALLLALLFLMAEILLIRFL